MNDMYIVLPLLIFFIIIVGACLKLEQLKKEEKKNLEEFNEWLKNIEKRINEIRDKS